MPARKRTTKPAEEEPTPQPARKRGVADVSSGEWGALKQEIAKQRGEGIVTTARNLPVANHIPTGAFTLDFATLGGPPEGHAFMFYGLESSGKTTQMLKTVAGFQRKHPDKIVVWFDPENMFDRDWAEQLGCNVDRMELIQPETGEECVDLIEAAMGAIEVGMVVLDSVPGCVPKTILDRSAEDQTMAVLARLMGLLCSKVLMAWSRERRRGHRVTLGIINQFRSKVGLVFGDPRTLPGGRQINHLPTTKIEIKNKEVMGEDKYGNEVVELNDHTFVITKAKHGSSIRNGQFQMIVNPDSPTGLNQGDFDDYKTVITFAKKFGILKGGGGKYSLPLLAGCADLTWKTFDELRDYLQATPPAYRDLRATIIAAQRLVKGLPPIPPDGFLVDKGAKVNVKALTELLADEPA